MDNKPDKLKGESSHGIKRPARDVKKAGRVLFSLAGVLLIAAAVIFALIYCEGIKAGRNAQELLKQYETTQTAGLVSPSPAPADQTPLPSGGISPPPSFNGYSVIGTLQIGSIGVELPVISETSDAALKTSVCFLQGAIPPDKGCMVITGHNYASGAHFGHLDQVNPGDTVTFSANGAVYLYEVSAMRTIKPDQAQALNDYSEDYSLILLTCTHDGNARLIVLCTDVK
jgi:sortase A